MLTEEQKQRYQRNILLKDVGEEGQEKLLRGKVLVIGTGGLGSPVCLYLAAAGVGHIGIIDADVVNITNLQRQIIHSTKDLGVLKIESAKEKMTAINPEINITTYRQFLNSGNAVQIIEPWDFIIDATDNYEAKFLINDTCVRLNKAFSHGAILNYEGMTFTHLPGTACYRCFFKEPPPDGTVPKASESGILGAIAGMTGTIQAAEALKYLLNTGDLLTDRLLTFDARSMEFRTIKLRKNPTCNICSNSPDKDIS